MKQFVIALTVFAGITSALTLWGDQKPKQKPEPLQYTIPEPYKLTPLTDEDRRKIEAFKKQESATPKPQPTPEPTKELTDKEFAFEQLDAVIETSPEHLRPMLKDAYADLFKKYKRASPNAKLATRIMLKEKIDNSTTLHESNVLLAAHNVLEHL